MNEALKAITQQYNDKIDAIKAEFVEKTHYLINIDETKTAIEKIINKEIFDISLGLGYYNPDFQLSIAFEVNEYDSLSLFISENNKAIRIHCIDRDRAKLSKILSKAKAKKILTILKIKGEMQYELY